MLDKNSKEYEIFREMYATYVKYEDDIQVSDSWWQTVIRDVTDKCESRKSNEIEYKVACEMYSAILHILEFKCKTKFDDVAAEHRKQEEEEAYEEIAF